MMSVRILQCMVVTHVFLFLFQHVTSRSTTVSYMNTTTSDVTPATHPTRTNEMKIMTSPFEVARNGSYNTSIVEEQSITDDNITIGQNSSQYVVTNVASFPTQSVHTSSDIEISSTVAKGIHEANVNESYLADTGNYEDRKANSSQNITDPSPLSQSSGFDFTNSRYPTESNNDSFTATMLYDDNATMSSMTSTELTTTESASTNNVQDTTYSEAGVTSSATTITKVVPVIETSTVGMVPKVATENIYVFTTGSSVVTDDGFQIDDVYLPVVATLIIILVSMLLCFFIYIIACNRVTSRRTAYSVSSSSAYSNEAFVAGVIATDHSFDDNGIEILRTAL